MLGREPQSPIFERLALIGTGSLTLSIADAVRAANAARTVVMVSRSAAEHDGYAVAQLAALEAADLVIIGTPPRHYESIAAQIGPYLPSGAVVTDVPPSDACAIERMQARWPAHVHWIPSHPIVESCLPQNRSAAKLFNDCACILTPAEHCDAAAVGRLVGFWRMLGARVQVMTAEQHDLALALVSHVPHLISYCLIGTVADFERRSGVGATELSPGYFRSFTEAVVGNQGWWCDTLLANRNAVLKMLSLLTEDIAILSKSIRRTKSEELLESLSRAREIRETLEYDRHDIDDEFNDEYCRCKLAGLHILDDGHRFDQPPLQQESRASHCYPEVAMKFAARLTKNKSDIAGLDSCRSAAGEGRIKRYALPTHNSAEAGVNGLWRRLQMQNLKIEAENGPAVGAMQVECLVIAPREPVLEELNRHSQTTQTFIPCDGPVLIAVARGAQEGEGEPDPASAQVVTCVPGEAVTIEKGVWHSAPYAFVETVKVLSVEHQLPAGVHPDIRDLPAEGWFGEIVWS